MIDVRVFFKLKWIPLEQENLKMILSPEQAKEVGEALVDASERSVEDNKDGYNIIAHITSP
jgi:hypothetical protein